MPADPFSDAMTLEGVPSAFAAARDGIDAVLRDRGLRRSTPEDTARSLALGAAATASLEGSQVPLGDDGAELLLAGGGDATARAALRLSGELLGLVPVWNRSPLQALARLHALAAAGSARSEELGRPASTDGARALAALAADVSASRAATTPAPGLVVAAIVHARLATSGAFSSHNGVVGRAAERLVLVATGVDPASVTVPELGHAREPDGYRRALAAVGTRAGGNAQWLNYAAQAFTRAAEASPLR